jgi:hypothetical protein
LNAPGVIANQLGVLSMPPEYPGTARLRASHKFTCCSKPSTTSLRSARWVSPFNTAQWFSSSSALAFE